MLRRALAAGAAFALASLTGCATTVNGHGRPACPLSAELLPSCGVLWGVATNPNTNAHLDAVEQLVGRRFDLVYRFQDLDDRIPTSDERAVVAGGQVLHLTIDARIFAAPQQIVTWAEVANGQFDASLTEQARGIASLRVPLFLTFDHEPDQPQRAVMGSPADFVAAWRHVHDLFRRAGATNAVWVWVVTGYPLAFPVAGQMWPGNAYVDWIGWEAYNSMGCVAGQIDPAQARDFAASALPFYDWMVQNGASVGIDISKPMMISEAGSVSIDGNTQATALWYAQIPAVLKAHPQIRAITLWDRPGPSVCRYQFDDLPTVRRAVADAGLQPAIRGK